VSTHPQAPVDTFPGLEDYLEARHQELAELRRRMTETGELRRLDDEVLYGPLDVGFDAIATEVRSHDDTT